MELLDVLKKYFGFRSFKKEQMAIIKEVLSGRDVLGVLPTGYGKSLCYEVPAMMMKGPTLVVSPLISLMKDQVDSLVEKGIPATYINSSLGIEESNQRKRNIRKGRYKLIYVSPESLKLKRFTDLLRDIKIAQVAVDEAHCISIWGHDFRPSYLEIHDFIETLENRPIVTAFTATATGEVIEDMERLLHLHDPYKVLGNLDRENIYFGVVTPEDEMEELLRQVDKRRGEQGIVYCQRKAEAQAILEELHKKGHKAGIYHGGINDEDRHRVQEDFSFDRINVVVATNAFGMGIDKSNVRYVLHMGIPKNVESFYQEAGRAGRDQSYSESILIYRPKDIYKQRRLLRISELTPERLQIEEKKLLIMDGYGKTKGCLRRYVLDYFKGQTDEPELKRNDERTNCGNCANCIQEGYMNLTVLARKILSALDEVGGKCTKHVLQRMLYGIEPRNMRIENQQKINAFGSMKNHKLYYYERLIGFLLQEGFMQSEEESLLIADKGKELLRGEREFIVSREKGEEKEDYQEELFLHLKKKRKELSIVENIAPYIIFHDENLREIVRKLPRTKKDFFEIRGVGKTKGEKYAEPFLAVIHDFLKSRGNLMNGGSEFEKGSADAISNIPDTYDLYREGKTVKEMAKILGIVPGTVVDRLIRDHEKGKEVELSGLFESALEEEIHETVERIGASKLKPIKDDLESRGMNVSYIDIKLVFYRYYGIRKK